MRDERRDAREGKAPECKRHRCSMRMRKNYPYGVNSKPIKSYYCPFCNAEKKTKEDEEKIKNGPTTLPNAA